MASTTSQPRPRPRSFDASDSGPISTPLLGGGKQKRLQTIESGIALNEAAGGHSPDRSNRIDVESTSPDSHQELLQWQVASSQSSSPVIYKSNSENNNLPPLHRRISDPPPPSLDLTTPKDVIDGKHSQTKHSYNPSSNSYYSVDAGKHGFFSLTKTKSSGSAGSDSDDNGSLVFKYTPGEETPPAEYALPASILKVYGEDEQVGVDHVVLRRNGSERSNCSSVSSTVEDDNPDGDGKIVANAAIGVSSMTKDQTGTTEKKKSQQVPPPLPLLAAGDDSPSASPEMRILPYHERKKLNEGIDVDNAKNKLDMQIKARQAPKKKNGSKKETREKGPVSGNDERQVMSPVGKDDKESSVLLTPHKIDNSKSFNHYGTLSNQNGYNINPKSDHNDHQQEGSSRTGWFGNLVTIVAGKDEHATIEKESKSYLDQGRAFLEKTEQERMKMKETSKRDELNQLTVPSYLNGHSRSRMSSLTTALYSIASCSDDDEGETTDEDSSSYEYDEDEESGTPVAANGNTNRVWRYGDKTVTSSKARKISRDERMKRERLIEEEYEYRLRALRHENERLSMRFRLCVLISVAFIFAGALSFALTVCIKMLFG